jgi:hypothetical protein
MEFQRYPQSAPYYSPKAGESLLEAVWLSEMGKIW